MQLYKGELVINRGQRVRGPDAMPSGVPVANIFVLFLFPSFFVILCFSFFLFFCISPSQSKIHSAVRSHSYAFFLKIIAAP